MAAIFDSTPYRGFDVLIAPSNENEAGQLSFERMLQDTDNDTSFPVRYDSAGLAFPKQKYVWYLRGRAAKVQFLKFLYRVRGRQKAFWVPSFTSDLQMLADVASNSVHMTIQNIGMASSTGIDVRLNDIAIIHLDGAINYRTIKTVTLIDAQTEEITVDKKFQNGLSMDAIEKICFMRLMRIDTDDIEIVHVTDTEGLATSAMMLKTVWNERRVQSS